MAGRQTADIVFCMDASGSMENAFNGVRNNVFKLIDGLKTNLQIQWDVRFDFLAYSNSDYSMRMQTLNYKGKNVLDKLEVICYNKGTTSENTQRSEKLWLNFTKNLPEWKTQSTAL